MKLRSTKQINIDEILDINFDLFLTSSGYESRARYLVETYSIKSAKKYCLAFNKHTDLLSRKVNDEVFTHNGFDIINCSGDKEDEILEILTRLIQKTTSRDLNILIDYSSMSRVWYAAILRYFKYLIHSLNEVNIYFAYSSSKFITPPTAVIYNRHVGPIEGFYSISVPTKPTALIIGLGYVPSRAYGLSEFLDVQPYLFIADSSSSDEFHQEVIKNNSQLIKSVEENNRFNYPLHNFLYTQTILLGLCKDLIGDFRVVLAPCGPKPFTLTCLITFLRIEGVDVWRISAGEDEIPVDKQPSGVTTVLKVCMDT